jgi:hypothetical protein
LKPSGTVVIFLPISFSFFSHRDAGLAAAVLVLGRGQAGPAAVEPVGLVGLKDLAFSNSASRWRQVGDHAVDSPWVMTPSAISGAVEFARRRVVRIFAYISGWVKVGSSPSL